YGNRLHVHTMNVFLLLFHILFFSLNHTHPHTTTHPHTNHTHTHTHTQTHTHTHKHTKAHKQYTKFMLVTRVGRKSENSDTNSVQGPGGLWSGTRVAEWRVFQLWVCEIGK